MKTNVGSLDRILRVTAGLAILGVGYYYSSWWGLIGFGPIITGTFRFCPAYPLLGMNTCSKDGK